MLSDLAAEFLHMHSVTLLRLAHSGEIPGAKPGKRWVFIDIDLADWLRAKYASRASEGGTTFIERRAKCHSSVAKTPRSGGLISPSTDIAYRDLLALTASKKQKNSMTRLVRFLGNIPEYGIFPCSARLGTYPLVLP